MPRGQKRTTTDKMSALQTKINNHKTQIANLEKQKSALQKETRSQTVSELMSFIEKKNLTVSDIKRLVNQSFKTPIRAAASKPTQVRASAAKSTQVKNTSPKTRARAKAESRPTA